MRLETMEGRTLYSMLGRELFSFLVVDMVSESAVVTLRMSLRDISSASCRRWKDSLGFGMLRLQVLYSWSHNRRLRNVKTSKPDTAGGPPRRIKEPRVSIAAA